MAPANLIYTSDDMPGFSRIRRGKGFAYYNTKGDLIADPAQKSRISALAIPPAYEDVWICPKDNGHLQATGLDDRGRKQYRYHPDWSAFKSEQKFDRLVDFGNALPSIRRRVRQDLKREEPDKVFVCAALVRLLDKAHLRIGNEAYTESNKSYGATTLRSKHVDMDDSTIGLNFTAKGGKRIEKTIRDAKLSEVLEEIDDLPGRNLFSYIGHDGEIYDLDSGHVNAYLSDMPGEDDFTAKTFRTWAASVAALEALLKCDKPTIKIACDAAAEQIHNTAATCRNSYIHPAVIDLAGQDNIDSEHLLDTEDRRELRQGERALMKLLSD